jgi:SAM-dependent methyltransferase
MTTSPSSAYHASDGAAYQVFLGRWTEVLAPAFLEFASISSDGDVIDVGCGTGSLAAEIARRGPDRRVIGLDVADSYLSYARAQRVLPNLHFQLGDAGLLPFAEGAFAASLSQLVLTFVTDPRQVAAEMVRVTRPGGVVASAVWDFCGGLVYQRILWDTAAALDPQASRTRDRLFSNPLSTPDGLEELWQTAGLVDIEVGSLTIRMNYANFDDYWEPLLGGQGPVGTFAAGLPEDVRRQLKTAVRAAFLSGRPDGPRSLTATAWAVRGIVDYLA